MGNFEIKCANPISRIQTKKATVHARADRRCRETPGPRPKPNAKLQRSCTRATAHALVVERTGEPPPCLTDNSRKNHWWRVRRSPGSRCCVSHGASSMCNSGLLGQPKKTTRSHGWDHRNCAAAERAARGAAIFLDRQPRVPRCAPCTEHAARGFGGGKAFRRHVVPSWTKG
jgi:hypothetical protein